MNYFLSWFNTWSELQKSDFVPVLADKMDNSATNKIKTEDKVNGCLSDKFAQMNNRPPSLFSCQVRI